MRDCQPLPWPAAGTRQQTSHNSAAFPSTPLPWQGWKGLDRRCLCRHVQHTQPSWELQEGRETRASAGSPAAKSPAQFTENPAGQSRASRTGRGQWPRVTHLHARAPCCAFHGPPVVPSMEKRVSHRSGPAHVFLSALRFFLRALSATSFIQRDKSPPLLSKLACHKCLEPAHTRAWLHTDLDHSILCCFSLIPSHSPSPS